MPACISSHADADIIPRSARGGLQASTASSTRPFAAQIAPSRVGLERSLVSTTGAHCNRQRSCGAVMASL